MKPFLFLHPDGLAHPSAAWSCRLLAPLADDVADLAAAAALLAGAPVCVVLPVELFSCWASGPWPGRRRPSLQAVGYAIEEQLSVPVETLHLVVGPRHAERRCAVRACDAQAFAQVLAVLANAGVCVAALYIDADLLPAQGPCGLWLFDRWLLREAGETRLAVSNEALAALSGDQGRRWDLLNTPQAPAVDACGQLRLQAPAALDLAPARQPAGARPWRWAAALLVALVLVDGLLAVAAGWQQAYTAAALQARTGAHLASLVPAPLRGQPVQQQLKALQQGAQPASPRLTERLQTLGDSLVGTRDLKLQRIEYRAGEGWKLYLSAPALADVERLSARAAHQGLALQLLTATQDSGRVQAVMGLEEE